MPSFPRVFPYLEEVKEAELIAENQALKAQNALLLANQEKLQNQLDAVLRLLKFGKSERYRSTVENEQLTLFDTPEAETPQPSQEKETITYERTKKKEKKSHPGRHPLPEHLERRPETIEPDLDPNFEWERIGEERTEILEHEPGDLYVRVIIRPTYKKKTATPQPRTEIKTAPMPNRLIPGSYVGISFLAHLVVAKLVDHLPFYRQIEQYKRDNDLVLAKSTINDWFIAVCTLLQPLYEVLRQQTVSQDYLQADESRIPVLTNIAKDKDGKIIENKRSTQTKASKIQQGWMWLIYDPVHRHVVFNYEMGRKKEHARTLLDNHTGYLQVDGYAAYDHLLKRPDICYVACMVHVRRKFYESLKNDKTRAKQALQLIKEIYALEDKVREADAETRYTYRLEHLKPKLEAFKAWLDKECVHVTPSSKIGKAMAYAQNCYEGLNNVLLDGRLEIDNNLIENTIRPLALGRKNYLFAGSHQGAQRLAIMYSFMATCKAQKVNPRKWLKAVLERIQDTKLSELHTLLPGNLDLD